MRKPRFLFTTILLTSVIAGCATSPISSHEAALVPPDSQFLYQQRTAETAQVLVKRDTGVRGSMCTVRVFLDGDLAAYLNPGEKVIFHVPGETVIIGADSGEGICGLGGLVETSVPLNPGNQLQFRVGYNENTAIGLYPTATE